MPEPLPDLAPQVELAAVRIAEEALTNAMRHAGARRAIVTLRCDADGVVVDVDDDGTSGPPSARRREGNGLVGMQETCGGLRRPTPHRHQPARRLADPRVAPDAGGVVVIRVVVVDDQAVIRTGLRTMLEHETDLTIVGEAGNGAEAVDPRRRRPSGRRPDGRADARGRRHRGDPPDPRRWAPSPPAVLVLTTFDDDEYVFGALRAGAAGFLLKDVGPDVLVAAVRTVAAGDALVDPRSPADWSSGGWRSRRQRPDAPPRARSRRDPQRPGAGDPRRPGSWPNQPRVCRRPDRQRGHGQDPREQPLTKLGVRSRVQAVVIAYEAGVVAARLREREGDVPWLP